MTIDHIIATLEQVEVHGKRNMNMLLGCILALEEIREGMKQHGDSHAQQRENAERVLD